jgi:hypothetical protein
MIFFVDNNYQLQCFDDSHVSAFDPVWYLLGKLLRRAVTFDKHKLVAAKSIDGINLIL